jgi:putative sigma-54 modulation protein
MDIYKMVGRNLDISDAMRNYAEEKLARLSRFSDQIIDAKVVMSYQQGNAEPATVEVQLNVPNGIIRAEEKGVDSYAAIDKVVDKLERQVKRFKGRMLARRTEEAPALEEAEETVQLPEIVRVKRHVLRPMSPEDAAIQMEALGHTFFMFHNVDTDAINVIYLRHDGDYGLLQPNS